MIPPISMLETQELAPCPHRGPTPISRGSRCPPPPPQTPPLDSALRKQKDIHESFLNREFKIIIVCKYMLYVYLGVMNTLTHCDLYKKKRFCIIS